MNTIKSYLTYDHKFCDKLLLAVKIEVNNRSWQLAENKFNKFLIAINWHINIEEDLLFPEFEKVTGIKTGPTYIMRLEHAEINKMTKHILNDLINQQKANFILNYEKFLAILQPHSTKEEQILYPMCDEQISEQVQDLLTQIENKRKYLRSKLTSTKLVNADLN